MKSLKRFRVLFFIITCSSVIGNVNGQLMVLNNATITLTAGLQLTVKGDIVNNTGSIISNNGIIDFTGNWINNSGNNIFGVSQGMVIMNGINQNIGGVNTTGFNNLTLVGGVKTLGVNTITGGNYAVPIGILNLSTSKLDLASKSLTINNANGTAITATTGFILSEQVDNTSKVTWKINNNPGMHTFLFGNAGSVQIPFNFNLAGGNAGDVTVSTYATLPNNTPYPTIPTLVTHVRNAGNTDNSGNTIDRFWEVSTTGTPVADLTFTWAPAEDAAAGTFNPRAQRWVSIGERWENALPGQFNPTGQSVYVPTTTAFGTWALALNSSPLPIELISFTANPTPDKQVLCKWITATELNNDFFTVERSVDGVNFNAIGKVDGAGNSNLPLEYYFTDMQPFDGLSYYRLKQTDFNGSFSYSQNVAVRFDKAGAEIIFYPNPADESLHFYAGVDIKYDIFINDANGKCVFKKNDITGNYILNLQQMASAVYTVKLFTPKSVVIKKLIIRH